MYFVNEENGYIISVQEGGGGTREITAEEYAAVIDAIMNRPEAPEGFAYRLRTDLTWEEYELPAVEADPDPEISDSEALEIILGGEG